MRNKLAKLLSLGAVSLLAAAAIAVVPTSAFGYQYEHVYCSQNMGVDGTCPPNGSSEWAHLELNLGDAGGESHETCIDDWYPK